MNADGPQGPRPDRPRGPRPDRPQGPWSFAAFRRIFIARAVSSAGSYMQIVAATWYAFHTTGDAASVGILTALALGPALVGSPIGGALADRFEPRRLAMALSTLQGLSATGMALLAWTGQLSMGWLYLLVLAGAIPFSLNQPVITLVVPYTVPPEYRQSALARSSMMFNITRLGGAVAGGFMVQWLGVAAGFAVNAATYFLVALVLAVTPLASDIARLERPGRSVGMREGIRDARKTMRESGVRRLTRLAGVAVAVFFTFIAPIEQLMPIVAHEHGMQPSDVGLLIGAIGVGAMLANPLLDKTNTSTERRRRLMATGLFLAAPGMVVLALTPEHGIVVDLLGAALIGFGWEFIFVGGQSTVAVEVPGSVRGRAMGLFFVLVTATTALGAVGLGSLINTWGMSATFLTMAALVVVAGVTLLILGSRPERQPARPPVASTAQT